MVHIPAGEFTMGSRADDERVNPWHRPHEQPAHRVYLDAFYIDTHEVTNAEYERLNPQHAREPRSPCDDCPVTDVTWYEAERYCSAQAPRKRLPTEAEWEKAAKGGAEEDPDPLADHAWYAANANRRTQPVGQKRANGYGVHDMLGNVREWTADWFDPDYYRLGIGQNPRGPASGQWKVERGGTFFLPAKGVRSTIRYHHPPEIALYFLGFRCAEDAG